jgi:hypothetical protein
MHFLVVDDRFGTPIYVILESDPRGERVFPTLRVREVTLEERVGPGTAVGRDPVNLDRFRMFRSDAAVAGAGFILIEPRYVGPDWRSYLTAFHPEGEKPHKHRREPVATNDRSPRPTQQTHSHE